MTVKPSRRFPIRPFVVAATFLPFAVLASAQPALAQETYGGVYAHAVDTPFTLETGEGGVDIAGGYRFAAENALSVIGSPSPYLVASFNLAGDTSFVGGGLSWKIGKGPVYVRPGIGIVVHDAPERRVRADGRRLDLGSRVLFEPEIAVGTRLNERLSIEASWMHVSHARLFDGQQNPGLDMIGARLNWRI